MKTIKGAGLQGALTYAAACTVRFVAAGPTVAHAEGHIVFASPASAAAVTT